MGGQVRGRTSLGCGLVSSRCSYMGGCWVPSRSPSHGSGSCGAARRRGPTGGRANGMDKYCFTLISVPLRPTYAPLTRPCFRDTTGPAPPARDRPPVGWFQLQRSKLPGGPKARVQEALRRGSRCLLAPIWADHQTAGGLLHVYLLRPAWGGASTYLPTLKTQTQS